MYRPNSDSRKVLVREKFAKVLPGHTSYLIDLEDASTMQEHGIDRRGRKGARGGASR